MLSLNPLAYAADHIGKNLSIKERYETKALDVSISLTELNSLKVFFRQLEQRDRDAIEEKVASLFQEYELLFSALVGPRNGNFYPYDAVRRPIQAKSLFWYLCTNHSWKRTGTPIR